MRMECGLRAAAAAELRPSEYGGMDGAAGRGSLQECSQTMNDAMRARQAEERGGLVQCAVFAHRLARPRPQRAAVGRRTGRRRDSEVGAAAAASLSATALQAMIATLLPMLLLLLPLVVPRGGTTSGSAMSGNATVLRAVLREAMLHSRRRCCRRQSRCEIRGGPRCFDGVGLAR